MKQFLFAALLLVCGIAVAQVSSVSKAFTSAGSVVDVSAGQYKFPITVSVYPTSGDTAKVEYSTTNGAAVNPGAANWTVSATLSAVTFGSTTKRETLPSAVTAIRFTTTTGAGTDTAELAWGY